VGVEDGELPGGDEGEVGGGELPSYPGKGVLAVAAVVWRERRGGRKRREE